MAAHSKQFIISTAADYDMDAEEVESIMKRYPEEELYERLEEFINERANMH